MRDVLVSDACGGSIVAGSELQSLVAANTDHFPYLYFEVLSQTPCGAIDCSVDSGD